MRTRWIAGWLGALREGDWRMRLLGGELRKWVILGVLIGVLVGLSTSLLLFTIDGATRLLLGGVAGLTPPLPSGEGSPAVTGAARPWLLPLVVAVGGLASGVIGVLLAREIEGGGTDAAIEAFHEHGGKIRARVAPLKLLASAIVLGSGGSAGREGPSAQIGAGVASWLGELFRLTPADRRIVVAVGMGAGIGAIFKAPLGGAILGAEMLYLRDFELEAIVPGLIASVVGYSIVSGFYGFTPVFGNGLGLRFEDPVSLLWYAVLGVAAGLTVIAYARAFFGLRSTFRAMRLPVWMKPAIGGLAVGLIALAFPQVLSQGYGWLQIAIEGNTAQLAVGTMLALVVLKILATSLTIGSGASGGDFAPVLYVGGMLGGGMWGLLHGHVGGMPGTAAPFVIVGMMALLGGAAKAPIAVMIMVAEMTGEFSMLVPAMVAAGIAYLVSGNTTLYEAQVPTRADSPAHRGEYTIPLIQALTVGQSMRREVVNTTSSERVAEAESRMTDRGLRGMPVVDEGRLVGMFTMTDALRAGRDGALQVGDAMTTDLVVAHPADSLHTALQRMARAAVSRLPVVERDAPERLIGILGMRDVAAVLDTEVHALAGGPRSASERPLDDPLRQLLVRDAMSHRFEALPQTLSLKRVANRLSASGRQVALLVDGAGALRGIVTLSDLERAAGEEADEPVDKIAHHNVIVARPTQSVAEALAQPGAEGLRQLPVVEQRGTEFVPVGILSRSDVLAAYLRTRDRQAWIAQRAAELVDHEDGRVTSIEIPVTHDAAVLGKTLAELQLPRDAVVTAVLRGDVVVIPRGQVQLQAGDRVQVLTALEARDEVLKRFSGASSRGPDESG
ncbi:MAG: chloride channel protein [Dehalococcoidia bacterium]